MGWKEKKSEISELYITMGWSARKDFGIDHLAFCLGWVEMKREL